MRQRKMHAGSLDRRIQIQRRTITRSESGGEVETWADTVTNLPAEYVPMGVEGGGERYTGEQWVARGQVTWNVRYQQALADLQPMDRVIYPAGSDNVQSPQFNHIYDIMDVQEIGRREGLAIKTARRSDVTL